jgi:hypothetical protein
MKPAARLAGSSAALGATLTDLVMAMAVVLVMSGLSAPVIANAVEDGRLRHAAGFIATRFRLARSRAAATSTAIAVLFDRTTGGRWQFRVCEDGNGNGVRRADVDAGRDRCVDGPHDLAALFPGVAVGSDPAIRGPDGEPGSVDPVRFGAGDLASFSPAGTCTSGSLWLRSRSGSQFSVRVAGVTGRARVLRYDRAAALWRDW